MSQTKTYVSMRIAVETLDRLDAVCSALAVPRGVMLDALFLIDQNALKSMLQPRVIEARVVYPKGKPGRRTGSKNRKGLDRDGQ